MINFGDGGESSFLRNKMVREVSWVYEFEVSLKGASLSLFRRLRRYGAIGNLNIDSRCQVLMAMKPIGG